MRTARLDAPIGWPDDSQAPGKGKAAPALRYLAFDQLARQSTGGHYHQTVMTTNRFTGRGQIVYP
jgi:hypothetical protein